MPKNMYALDFTQQHYAQLLDKLNVAKNEEFYDDKKGAIRRGLIEYFALSHQKVVVKTTFTTCTIHKQFIDPSRHESFDRMVHRNASILLDIFNRKSEFMPLDFLVSIPENIRTKIIQEYIDTNENIDTARHLTRQQINTIFGLDPRDIIFFIRGRISIRYYTPPKKLPKGTDKRFAGESPELMDEMYAKYFPDGAWSHIEPILEEVILDKLNFSVIDNLTFSKTFIPVFRSMIEILLLEIVTPEDRIRIEGFTGYVLRQYFHDILIYVAKNLLKFVENRDKNAEMFIKYFNEEVVVDAAGNRIQKHSIIDNKQQKWNFSSIISIMMQYKQANLRIAAQNEAIITAQTKVSEAHADIALEINSRLAIMDKIADIESMISENEMKLLQVKSKSVSKENEAMAQKSDIARLQNNSKELKGRMKSENNQLELIKGRITNKKNDYTRRQKKLQHEKKMLETIHEQVDPIIESYEGIVEAIAIVLPKR